MKGRKGLDGKAQRASWIPGEPSSGSAERRPAPLKEVMRSASEFRKGEAGRNMFRCDDQVAHGTYSSLWDGSQTPVAKLRKSMPSP